MISSKPLLTIIIPTRNRFGYAKHTIQSVTKIDDPYLQIAVQDNSDTNILGRWLDNNIDDIRLVYHYSDKPVSMNENYELSLNLADGEYICLIGDDDSVNPEIIEATRWAKDNDLDALTPSSPINYVWPDLQMKSIGSMKAGELSIRHYNGKKTFPDPITEILKCVRDAGQDFHYLPKAYYGIVNRKCMDLVKNRSGNFFPGISPDMSAAISLAIVCKRICHVDYPLFIPGSSAKSNAGLSGLKKHIGFLRDQPHLPPSCERDWSDIIPMFYSVQTIWAEATVNALTSMGRNDLLIKFNLPLLYALCSVFHYQYMGGKLKTFYNALKLLRQSAFAGTSQLVYWFCYWWILRLISLLQRLSPIIKADNSVKIYNQKNIEYAVQSVIEYLDKTEVVFKNVFK
jgi:glycosyltransferase involved in cell wall biosynthesis